MLKSLRDIRNVRVIVFHPKDRERDELITQIRRIGCRVEAIWPPQNEIPSDADVLFVLFRQDASSMSLAKSLESRPPGSTLIGIVEFESPNVIECIVQAGTTAVITKPIRAFGLLTSIVLAHTLTDKFRSSSDRVKKLELRLSSLKQIEKAKALLMDRKGLTEQAAYDFLRARAMSKRTTMESICSAIVEANEVFGE